LEKRRAEEKEVGFWVWKEEKKRREGY